MWVLRVVIQRKMSQGSRPTKRVPDAGDCPEGVRKSQAFFWLDGFARSTRQGSACATKWYIPYRGRAASRWAFIAYMKIRDNVSAV